MDRHAARAVHNEQVIRVVAFAGVTSQRAAQMVPFDELANVGEQTRHAPRLGFRAALVNAYPIRYAFGVPPSLARRRALMVAALGFAMLDWRRGVPPAAVTLSRWLKSWRGVGDILAGMTAQGFNVELRGFPGAWRANFYPTGNAHSIVVGSAWEPTPWRAVQRAAWKALRR